MAAIPSATPAISCTIPITSVPQSDRLALRRPEGWATYRQEEGCRQCGGDLEVFLEQTQETTPPIGPEWQPSAERCTQYDNGCEYRQLFGDHIELGEEWTITRID